MGFWCYSEWGRVAPFAGVLLDANHCPEAPPHGCVNSVRVSMRTLRIAAAIFFIVGLALGQSAGAEPDEISLSAQLADQLTAASAQSSDHGQPSNGNRHAHHLPSPCCCHASCPSAVMAILGSAPWLGGVGGIASTTFDHQMPRSALIGRDPPIPKPSV